MAGACSTDRLSQNPFTSPFSAADYGKKAEPEPTRTGSLNPDVDPLPGRAIRSEPIRSEPLAPVRSAAVAPLPAPPASTSTSARPRTASGGAGWSSAGGTNVIVGPGETLSTLTARYGVPADAILSANGMKLSDIVSGRRVVIPVYSATENPGAKATRQVEAPSHAAPAPAASRVVASQPIDVRKPAPRTVAEAAPPKTQLRPGARPVVAAAPKAAEPARPAVRVVEIKQAPAKVAAKVEPKSEPRQAPKVAAKTALVEKPAPVKVAAKPEAPKAAQKDILLPAKARPVQVVEAAKPAPKAEPVKVAAATPAKPVPAEPVKVSAREPETTASIAPAAPAQTSGGSSDFRWPARGRVISGFGGGGGNEGINIAVPEGTPVKAAGDGVVAYAGSEVKGYGNLVLIRHDNGYVSAYANNGQIDVKRGQRVNRGQSIAKSGQTGNVTSPQLHFEIRKGSTPVDPMKHLASAE